MFMMPLAAISMSNRARWRYDRRRRIDEAIDGAGGILAPSRLRRRGFAYRRAISATSPPAKCSAGLPSHAGR